MFSSSSTLGVIFAALTAAVLVLSPGLVDGVGSVNCWECDTDNDPLCGDDKWAGTPSSKVARVNCANSELQPAEKMLSKFTVGVVSTATTTCIKFVGRADGKVVGIRRSCGLPGISADECKKEKQGAQVMEACVCKGDYCNGSEGRTEVVVAATSLGAAGLLIGVLYKMAIFG